MSTVHSGYKRDLHDWYVEPEWCIESLFNSYPLSEDRWIHDPCCGQGTIPIVAANRGFYATGADLIDRAEGKYKVQNFFWDETQYDCIVTNPPYRATKEVIERAIRLANVVAVITPLKFLASQRRYKLFQGHRPAKVVVMSRRPSMPPGGRGVAAKGGSIDYCWIIWDVDRQNTQSFIGWSL